MDKPMCENHPDRPATYQIGGDSFTGSGVEFKPSHSFCKECRDEWRKKNIVIERT